MLQDESLLLIVQCKGDTVGFRLLIVALILATHDAQGSKLHRVAFLFFLKGHINCDGHVSAFFVTPDFSSVIKSLYTAFGCFIA